MFFYVLRNEAVIITVFTRVLPQEYYYFFAKKSRIKPFRYYCTVLLFEGVLLFILTCHYKLLYNINIHSTLLLTFQCKSFVYLGNYSSSMPWSRGTQLVYYIIYGISIVSWPSKFTRTISYLDRDGYKYFRYENTSDKCLRKIWCSTIQGCGKIKIISKNKDRIVPQCGTIWGCGTNRVNMANNMCICLNENQSIYAPIMKQKYYRIFRVYSTGAEGLWSNNRLLYSHVQ